MARQNEKGRVPQAVKDAYQRGFEDGLRQQTFPVVNPSPPGPGTCNACAALSQLTSLGLDHIRIKAEDAGKVVAAKAAIRTAQWPRHYVFYKALHYPSTANYLSGLLGKVEAVARGELRPSPDVWNG